jgi:exonuclease III
MTGITTYLSILTLNVNELNFPIKRHQLANRIKKEDPTICCLQETHLTKEIALVESETLEEDLPRQWSTKTGRSSNTYLGQSRLQTYIDQTR